MKWIITGGAGFIGTNVAHRLLRDGNQVVIYDNLSRKGADHNLEWARAAGHLEFVNGDVRNPRAIDELFKTHANANICVHLAGQVAVTTSVADPRTDFEINAIGTFNVCEAIRQYNREIILIYASTNKVYGGMEDIQIAERQDRYEYASLKNGVSEIRALDFHSPYGCSKGCADQYVIDYARVYGLRFTSLRQSCIYGYRQFGVEDQGWVAWFIICAVLGRNVTIFGNGKQVRDVLFIDDLVSCYVRVADNIDKVRGTALNIGGGPHNTLSLIELLAIIRDRFGKHVKTEFSDWRPGDQKVYVSDILKAKELIGWSPTVSPIEGVTELYSWVSKNIDLLKG